jgi:N-acetylglucosaminyl-diphospho-decaprenol L-rhamnosyltransferase
LAPYPCTWLIPSRNVGFGGGCQLAATTCEAEVYAFFNAHVTIDRSSVERCAVAFEDERVGIAAPCVYHPSAEKPERGWRYARSFRTYSRILGMPIQIPLGGGRIGRPLEEPGLIDNDWATGGAIFCRNKVITEVGWDGSYFLTFEDVDICLRAKRCGWRIVLVSPAIAFHNGESTRTSAMSAYYGMRNALWFTRRFHRKSIQALTTMFLCLLLFRIAAADRLKRRRPSHAALAIRGLRDGWLPLPSTHEALPGEPLPRS